MGSIANKYRVHEVAKDFGVSTKEITEILTKYAETPKNHMQVLEDRELSLIFEYLTQHNPVSSIAVIYAEGAKAEEKKPAPAAKPAQSAPAQSSGKPQQQTPAAGSAKPAEQPKQPMSRVPQRQVVDTRKATNVNLDKYDEKLQDMADARSSGKRDQQVPQGKEKFRNKQRRDNNFNSNKRKQEEADRLRKLRLEVIKKTPVTVQIPDEISVGELASRMKKTGAEVVKCLMKNGIMASLSQMIDFDTAAIIAEELGCKVEKEVVVTIEERLIDDHQDKDEDLVPRAPVVVVMGHVDHGKTSLLDYIRNAHVASGEAGGITQHIGAYQVEIHGKPITFLDTPGHEAFTSMRARGAMVTDIAILVVAAEDGIMPQTVESINHAKAAGIPIIVAINKMDKPEANPERIKQQLTEYGLVCEEWGGDTIVCPISAKTGMGVDNLLEMLILTAEVGELKANPNRAAQGTVIEARLDKGRGPVATLLVQNGTLHQGDIIIAGTSVGRVRAMVSDKGQRITEAGPSVPVEITGLSEAPAAGATFNAVADEKLARELVEQRKAEEKAKANAPVTKVSLEDLFSQIQAGEMKNLNLIVKADVQGSVEAVKASGLHIPGHHRGLQRPPGRRRPRERRPRQRGHAHVPRHLRRHQRDRGRHEGHAGSQVPGGAAGSRRGTADLQGVRRGHRGRLLCAGRQAAAQGLPGASGAGRHRDPRGRAGLPAAVQGLRQGGAGRLRVRPEHREIQRHQGRRHRGGLHHGADRGITNSRWVGERPPIFFLKGGAPYGRKPHRTHQ